MSGGVVCGFWDEAAGLAGLGWELDANAGGLVLQGGEVSPATSELSEDGTVRLILKTADETLEAELSPSPAATTPAGANGNGTESAPCAATVRVTGQRRVIECRGYVTRWGADPLAGAGVLRHLAMPAAEGGVLVVLGRGEPGADFAGESSSALLLDSDGDATSYPDAWLSTEYDDDGRQTRAGLELWSAEPEAPPMRAAGTLVGQVPEPHGGVTAAMLRTSAEGAPGLGSYLIWRG
jgi:hypothetical protein